MSNLEPWGSLEKGQGYTQAHWPWKKSPNRNPKFIPNLLWCALGRHALAQHDSRSNHPECGHMGWDHCAREKGKSDTMKCHCRCLSRETLKVLKCTLVTTVGPYFSCSRRRVCVCVRNSSFKSQQGEFSISRKFVPRDTRMLSLVYISLTLKWCPETSAQEYTPPHPDLFFHICS